MRRATVFVGLLLLAVGPLPAQGKGLAKDLLVRLGTDRGICVLLGDTTGERALALAKHSSFLLYVQLDRTTDLRKVRERVDEAGLYGTRIYVEHGDYRRIHLANNLADALVVSENATDVDRQEVLRVLRPQGRALIGQRQIIKPVPKGIDDWSHPMHGPDNNPQSRDQLARAPYLTQFLAEPLVGPHPQLTVSSGGRVFKVYGSLVRHPEFGGETSWQNKLVALSGYNGSVLWKRNLDPKFPMNRRTLIATPDTLFVGDNRSCKLIDPATGRVKDEITPPKSVTGGTTWKWMALDGGVLYAMVGAKDTPPQRRRRGDVSGALLAMKQHLAGKVLLAINPTSKRILWSHRASEPIQGC